MLFFVFNISKITGRKIHLVTHIIAGLFARLPRGFDCRPIRTKVNCLHWSLCHIHSSNYSSLFFLDMLI